MKAIGLHAPRAPHRIAAVVAGLALGCTIMPPAEPGEEALVSPDAPVFEQERVQRGDLDLSRFWTELDPDVREAPVPLTHTTFADVAAGAERGVVNIYTRRVVKRELRIGIHPNDLLPIRLPIVSPILDIIPFQVPVPFRDEGLSLGSGFVVNEGGYILTNAHVVQNATDVRVVFAGRREASAKIVGADPVTDTALLRVTVDYPLTPLPLGDSDALGVGELVVALGNPLGLGHTVTSGLVSATERMMPGERTQLLDFIQTDSAINPGSSGGPLVDLHGEVVGINTAIVSDAQLIGFAVPINTVKSVLPLLLVGDVERGWLGVSALPLTWEEALDRGLDEAGAPRVESVADDSPASRAGLRVDDLIVDVDGEHIDGIVELRRRSLGFLVGDEVRMGVLRGEERVELRLVLGRRPS